MSDLDALLDVQAIDTRLDVLRHQRANHPIQAEIDGIDVQRRAATDAAATIEAERTEMVRAQKRIDDDVVAVRAKKEGAEAKLYDGSVAAHKELLAVQAEIASYADRQTELEDAELEVMEQVEEIDGRLTAARAAVTTHDDRIAVLEAELAVALEAVDAELATVEAERLGAAAAIPAALLERYDGIRSSLGGVGVARLSGGTCLGCGMTLSAVTVDQIKKMPPDAEPTCEECGRLLVR